MSDRSTFLLMSEFERLEEWCRLVSVVFDGEVPYLVGSAGTTRDYRDVDIRVMLADKAFDEMFGAGLLLTKIRLLNRAISIWGQQETGLPIDFQVQRMTEANEAYGVQPRNPMGLRDWATTPTSGVPKP